MRVLQLPAQGAEPIEAVRTCDAELARALGRHVHNLRRLSITWMDPCNSLVAGLTCLRLETLELLPYREMADLRPLVRGLAQLTSLKKLCIVAADNPAAPVTDITHLSKLVRLRELKWHSGTVLKGLGAVLSGCTELRTLTVDAACVPRDESLGSASLLRVNFGAYPAYFSLVDPPVLDVAKLPALQHVSLHTSVDEECFPAIAWNLVQLCTEGATPDDVVDHDAAIVRASAQMLSTWPIDVGVSHDLFQGLVLWGPKLGPSEGVGTEWRDAFSTLMTHALAPLAGSPMATSARFLQVIHANLSAPESMAALRAYFPLLERLVLSPKCTVSSGSMLEALRWPMLMSVHVPIVDLDEEGFVAMCTASQACARPHALDILCWVRRGTDDLKLYHRCIRAWAAAAAELPGPIMLKTRYKYTVE